MGRGEANKRMTFSGFTNETVPWFDGLALDNSRAYFAAHKDVYERSVRQPLLDLLTDLSEDFGGTVKLFRQNRDVRFAADKSPYKTNSYGVIHSRPDTAAALYVSVSVDGLHAATGYYELASDQLARYRRCLSEGDAAVAVGNELRAILEHLRDAGYEVDGSATKGMPRGIAKTAPNADLLRYKSLTAGGYLDGEQMGDASAAAWVAGVWRAAMPLNAWLDGRVGESILPPEERWR